MKHCVHAGGIIKKEHMCPTEEFYIDGSMNKQYIEGVQKGKWLTWQVWVISPCCFDSLEGSETISLLSFDKQQGP